MPKDGRTVVIAAYRPKKGKEKELLKLSREHLPILREEGLATGRGSIVCQASDGVIVEIFEWEPGGIERAHKTPRVCSMWERYFAICDAVPLRSLPETAEMFAAFHPVDVTDLKARSAGAPNAADPGETKAAS